MLPSQLTTTPKAMNSMGITTMCPVSWAQKTAIPK